MLVVSAGMVSLNALMLSVLSFSSPNSERRLDMEYKTDLNRPHHSIRVHGTTTGNLTASRFDHIISPYLFHPRRSDGQIYR